jgi:diguanylate cyclase (GGDEF)-like protein
MLRQRDVDELVHAPRLVGIGLTLSAQMPFVRPCRPQSLSDRTKIYVRGRKFSEREGCCFSLSPRGNYMHCQQEQLRRADLLERVTGDDVRVLRALIGISRAVLGTQGVDDVLEVIAEKTLAALGATSVSISRWECQRGVLRTLINVGELGPGEERWPANEEYSLTDYRCVLDSLRQGESYVNAVDGNHEATAASAAPVRRLSKASQLAVPVMHDSVMWGELWATGTRGRLLSSDDVRLLESIAAQMSVAIGRAELFSEVSRYAYEDPLTRLANRRGLDECLRELAARDNAPTLLVCDLDGLKEVNDRDGHPAGDALLRGVAGALRNVASDFQASLVARYGGDEFCVILPGPSLAEAERFARIASGAIARELGPAVTLCWGAAAGDTEISTANELVAAADAALIEAKRLGRGRLRLRGSGDPGLPMGTDRRRESVTSGRRPVDSLIDRYVGLLDQRRPTTTLAALELLAYELCHAANAAAWSLSATTDDFAGVRTVMGVEAQLDPYSGLRVVEPAKDASYSPVRLPCHRTRDHMRQQFRCRARSRRLRPRRGGRAAPTWVPRATRRRGAGLTARLPAGGLLRRRSRRTGRHRLPRSCACPLRRPGRQWTLGCRRRAPGELTARLRKTNGG